MYFFIKVKPSATYGSERVAFTTDDMGSWIIVFYAPNAFRELLVPIAFPELDDAIEFLRNVNGATDGK